MFLGRLQLSGWAQDLLALAQAGLRPLADLLQLLQAPQQLLVKLPLLLQGALLLTSRQLPAARHPWLAQLQSPAAVKLHWAVAVKLLAPAELQLASDRELLQGQCPCCCACWTGAAGLHASRFWLQAPADQSVFRMMTLSSCRRVLAGWHDGAEIDDNLAGRTG